MTMRTKIAPSGQFIQRDHSVDDLQTLSPPGGMERLAAAGIHLTGEHMRIITESWHATIDPKVATFRVWPVSIEDGNVNIGGTCPLCRRFHRHSLATNPLKYPHCADSLPPFHSGKLKPLYYRVGVVVDVLPDEIAFAVEAPTADLLNYTALALQFREARRLTRSRTIRWHRDYSAVAFRAIVRSGVLDERAAILQFDCGMDKCSAEKAALSHYIRSRGPGRMRLRLARALMAAWKDAGRGVA
ncbi:hypothetical protein [Mesorhizobium xinjiangense]|uniref:hypothetical protein n=1 Tax=Mesorhizobium xinjiangense TaxID=2678685 RepID=UPI0012ECD93D|nr:hypothetical protein [Mesorhizobium xinjiangense]